MGGPRKHDTLGTGRRVTWKQARWVEYFVETGNATEAAVRAGYSKKSAKFIGHENYTKPYLRDEIERLQGELHAAKVMEIQEACERASGVARARLTDFLPPDTFPGVNLSDAERVQAIQELVVEIDAEGARKYKLKLRDPVRAMKQLGQWKGWDAPKQIEARAETINLGVGVEVGAEELARKIEAWRLLKQAAAQVRSEE